MLLRKPAISNLPLSLLLDSLSIVHLFPLKSTSIFIFLVKFRNSLGNCYNLGEDYCDQEQLRYNSILCALNMHALYKFFHKLK
jgi:hypothetical protein